MHYPMGPPHHTKWQKRCHITCTLPDVTPIPDPEMVDTSTTRKQVVPVHISLDSDDESDPAGGEYRKQCMYLLIII